MSMTPKTLSTKPSKDSPNKVSQKLLYKFLTDGSCRLWAPMAAVLAAAAGSAIQQPTGVTRCIVLGIVTCALPQLLRCGVRA